MYSLWAINIAGSFKLLQNRCFISTDYKFRNITRAEPFILCTYSASVPSDTPTISSLSFHFLMYASSDITKLYILFFDFQHKLRGRFTASALSHSFYFRIFEDDFKPREDITQTQVCTNMFKMLYVKEEYMGA